jgi:hypothetical protein
MSLFLEIESNLIKKEKSLGLDALNLYRKKWLIFRLKNILILQNKLR